MMMKIGKWACLIVVGLLTTMMYGGHIENHGCEPCHTPHHSPSDDIGFPLWSGHATEKTFDLYSSETMAATTEQPTGSSKLCLSCHDGSNPYIARLDDGHTVPANFENDLSRSHPISFEYAVTYEAKPTEYVSPELIPAGYLEKGRVECSSCHDVHDGEGFAGTKEGIESIRGFEWKDGPDGGKLCQVCHLKG